MAALLSALLPSPSASPLASILASVKLVNCSRPVPPSSPSGPVLLFSPGYGGTHHGYASILQAAASSGYTVVAIDHTYEAAAVVFPDGFVAYPTDATNTYDNSTSGQNFLQAVRMADAVSVLDAIEHGDVPGLGRYSNSSYNSNPGNRPDPTCAFSSTPLRAQHKTNSTCSSSSTPLRALMYGHSFGGSTAVNIAATDARVLAAANIDGPFYPPVANGNVRKPLLLMQSASSPPVAADWPAFYPAHVRGWKTWVRPNNTAHYGYTDLPLLADLLGLRGDVIPEELIGTANSRRLQEIVWRYTLQFFAYVLRGATPDLLNGPSREFPDVKFVGHAESGTGQ